MPRTLVPLDSILDCAHEHWWLNGTFDHQTTLDVTDGSGASMVGQGYRLRLRAGVVICV